ncbi:hypothetical protein VTL71DRAFT_15801 [Oculimacula yallundae]|uniref:2EXR domain-containing protein n=1 Tax=Oculimacula yallundae TaxID=86028 RepID=A0ABR4CD77_9HELO
MTSVLEERSSEQEVNCDDFSAMLQIFDNELPDSEQTISTEDTRLSEFTLFKNLPVELRLKIWNLCLPKGRRLCLYPDMMFRPSRSSPITSRINAESRKETLSTYSCVQLGFRMAWQVFRNPQRIFNTAREFRNSGSIPSDYLWDAAHDILRLQGRAAHQLSFDESWSLPRCSGDETKPPYGLSTLRNDETGKVENVRNLEMCWPFSLSDESYEWGKDADRRFIKCMKMFRSVREIAILEQYQPREERLKSESLTGKRRIEWIRGIFEEIQKEDSAICIPKIYLNEPLPDTRLSKMELLEMGHKV